MPYNDPKALFHSAPDGILVVDAGGRIVDVNREGERLFGYARTELEGQSIEILIPQEARDRHVGHRSRYVADAARRPMGVGLELTALRKDGSQFPVEISLNQVEGEGGAFTIATVRDVSVRKRLRDFGAGALRAAEDVRTLIAQELHDDTAQQISAHLIRLKLLENAETDEQREEHLEQLREGLRETAEGVRRIARGLRPPELEDAGLFAALQAHARLLDESRGFQVGMEVQSVDRYLTPDGLLVLYRIIQEALTNAARHAGADTAAVSVVTDGRIIEAVITDQGCGFASDRLISTGGGLGLMGMQERAVMVGGRLEIESQPGKGTRIAVRIPVEFDAEVERV